MIHYLIIRTFSCTCYICLITPDLYGNHGCQKGDMEKAFQYAIDMGGVDTSASYPYEGVQGKCRFLKSKDQSDQSVNVFMVLPFPNLFLGSVTAPFRSYQRVYTGDELALQSAVALQGPIAIAVDALHNTFRVKKDKIIRYYWILHSFPINFLLQSLVISLLTIFSSCHAMH